ncbi:class I SAM-dependent methyltransferase [Paenibacillus flagellatus]|uniref:Class I SAM-dependent methyltransferase n=1 Tax=Paenibacillus flagellatus TaxID=2211139 RepID=A0A2V5KX14_9BACL|nr:class I SAM-dependent methyltransferase [Paenibacillus flagellatus]PYI54276.1 class I SAM-dependent methyltransferase [Paenibacillus flagellatus]
MGGAVADRLRWAVDTLKVAPSDRLLEIGCGNGAAVSLIGDMLVGGTITAIDRSAGAIRIAAGRNAGHVSSGRAVFVAGALHEADLGRDRYDKIFAVNVNVFWMDADRELAILRERLSPGGALYLFNQPPAADKLPLIAERTSRNLLNAGFRIRRIFENELLPVAGVCVIGD